MYRETDADLLQTPRCAIPISNLCPPQLLNPSLDLLRRCINLHRPCIRSLQPLAIERIDQPVVELCMLSAHVLTQ